MMERDVTRVISGIPGNNMYSEVVKQHPPKKGRRLLKMGTPSSTFSTALLIVVSSSS